MKFFLIPAFAEMTKHKSLANGNEEGLWKGQKYPKPFGYKIIVCQADLYQSQAERSSKISIEAIFASPPSA